jgi:hypothetical protein
MNNLRYYIDPDLLEKEKAMYTEVVIGGNGFFAGCKIYIDPTLPIDTIEWRGANRVRLNIRTGEITVTERE